MLLVLNDPAASGKLSVDIVPGQLFRRLIHDLSIPLMDVTPKQHETLSNDDLDVLISWHIGLSTGK